MTDPPVWIARRAQPGVPVPGRSPAGACTTVARTVAVRATVPPWCPPAGRPSPMAAPSRRAGLSCGCPGRPSTAGAASGLACRSCGCRAAGCGSGAAHSASGCAAWKKKTRKTGRSKQVDSYDVRFWDTKKIADNASGGRYRVRWAVNGQEHCPTPASTCGNGR